MLKKALSVAAYDSRSRAGQTRSPGYIDLRLLPHRVDCLSDTGEAGECMQSLGDNRQPLVIRFPQMTDSRVGSDRREAQK